MKNIIVTTVETICYVHQRDILKLHTFSNQNCQYFVFCRCLFYVLLYLWDLVGPHHHSMLDIHNHPCCQLLCHPCPVKCNPWGLLSKMLPLMPTLLLIVSVIIIPPEFYCNIVVQQVYCQGDTSLKVFEG